MPYNESPFGIRPKIDDFAEAPKPAPSTIDSPLIRKVSFGDLAEPTVQALVVELFREGTIAQRETDTEILTALNTGSLEAWWILDERGNPAGLITSQMGRSPFGQKTMWVASTLIVAAHMTDAGWEALIGFGKQIARESGCEVIEWVTSPENKRIIEISRAAGARESHVFTLKLEESEVSHG